MSDQPPRPSQMDTSRPPARLLEESSSSANAATTPKLFATADNAVPFKGSQTVLATHRRTRGKDYSWRSFVAGGIAGCAVRHTLPQSDLLEMSSSKY